MAVKPVPEGYQTVIPYLIIKNPASTIEFAKNVLNAVVLDKMETPEGEIVHAELRIGDSVVMMGQSSEQYPPQPCMLHIYITDVDEAFNRAVKAGAKVVRALENQFYGDRSALVADANDISWNLSTHVEDVTPAEMQKRAEDYYKSK